MKKLLVFGAVIEALTGLSLLVYPPVVIRLLFGSEIAGVGILISRIGGVALIALGVACWRHRNTLRQFFGLLTYNAPVAFYLGYLGLSGAAGILLWPAVALHAGMAGLLFWAWWMEAKGTVSEH
jgi:hypothetical protein